eukprot:835840_1
MSYQVNKDEIERKFGDRDHYVSIRNIENVTVYSSNKNNHNENTKHYFMVRLPAPYAVTPTASDVPPPLHPIQSTTHPTVPPLPSIEPTKHKQKHFRNPYETDTFYETDTHWNDSMKSMRKEVQCMDQIDGLQCHDTYWSGHMDQSAFDAFFVQYAHQSKLGFRIQRNHKMASNDTDGKPVKRGLVGQKRAIFVKQWKEEKDAQTCVLTQSTTLHCNRCDDPDKEIKSNVEPHKQNSKAGSIGKKCPCKMNVQYYTLYKDSECVGEKVIISDSLLDMHTHDVDWNNRHTCLMSSFVEKKGKSLMATPIRLPMFRRLLKDYIGKHRRKDGISQLQQDVLDAYGFTPDLSDPVFNPHSRKLNYLWTKIRMGQKGGKNMDDQAVLRDIIKEFKANKELFDDAKDLLYVKYHKEATEEEPKQDFTFIYQTQRQKELLSKYGKMTQVDAKNRDIDRISVAWVCI